MGLPVRFHPNSEAVFHHCEDRLGKENVIQNFTCSDSVLKSLLINYIKPYSQGFFESLWTTFFIGIFRHEKVN